MAHPIRLTALLTTAILLPSVTLVAQPPAAPPTRNEPTAKDVIKDFEKSEKAVTSKSSDPIERIKEEGCVCEAEILLLTTAHRFDGFFG